MKISVVIPVYNGEKTVETLNEKLIGYLKKSKYDFEIVYVHDYGDDNSLEKLETLEVLYPNNVKLIKLNRNFGQHNAIICGFNYCTGDFIVTMDEDLQHDPDDILKLIKEQKKEDYDVVYGFYNSPKHSGFRNLTSRVVKKLLSIAIPELHKDYSAYRLIRTSVAKETIKMKNSYTFLDGYLTWITQNISSTQVSHNERLAGDSSYNFKTLFRHLSNVIFTFSKLPITLLTYGSLLMILISLFFSVYQVANKLFFNNVIPGYASVIVFIAVGVSMILFGLSIIGEYLFRINLKTTKRPNYIVKKTKK